MGRGARPIAPLFVGLGLLAAACTSGGRHENFGQVETNPPTGGVSSPTASSTSVVRPVPGAFVRACGTDVYGDLGNWRKDKNAVEVGPLGFLYLGGYADVPRSAFAQPADGLYAQKVLVVVDQGAVVTVAIPAQARQYAALLYDPGAFNDAGTYRLSDGEDAVTFVACAKGQARIGPPGEPTQFNGGFIVAGARCVPLDIWVEPTATPRRIVASFGAGECAR